jgi:acyl-CoA synthetase (AMP-forming)/AMP-acid ligase II
LLLFTSGTSGAPKACLCTQGRLARIGTIVTQMFELTEDDVCYLTMPLFHSNALMAGWAPALAAGATAALRPRFSASQFLPDVRKHGVTYFNYVGKPLSYVLATPEQPDDAENTLRRAFDNEAANAARLRNGWYWTGDLAYRSEDDFFSFAGRDYDWLRVDGENFAAAPVEAILTRHPDVVLASVYAVPDTAVGDQVMAALLMRPGSSFDPQGFEAFLAGETDFGTKWAPKYVRACGWPTTYPPPPPPRRWTWPAKATWPWQQTGSRWPRPGSPRRNTISAHR